MRLVIVEPLAVLERPCPGFPFRIFFFFFFCAVSMKSGKFIDCTYVALFPLAPATHPVVVVVVSLMFALA